MNKEQLSQVDMYRAVIALCVKYPNVAGIILAFKKASDTLGVNLAAIKAAELIESRTGKSVAGSKNELKDLLAGVTVNVAAALYALATATDNENLLAEVHYTPSDFTVMKQEILLTVASAMYDLAVQFESDLDAYGISKTVINSMPGIIDGFGTAIPTIRIKQAARKAAGQTIKTLIAETSVLLKSQMDKTVLILKQDNPEFYHEYRSSRKTVQPGVIHTSIRGSVGSGKMPVYNAFVEIVEPGLTVYSDLEGMFDSGKIKKGIYNVRVGAPGFVTQTFGNVEVKLGKAVKLDIVLVAEAAEKSEVTGMSKVA